jgi:hypothetical protein
MLGIIFLNIFYLIWVGGSLFGCIILFENGDIIVGIFAISFFGIGGGSLLANGQFYMIKEFLISRLENAKGKEFFSKIYNSVRFDDL